VDAKLERPFIQVKHYVDAVSYPVLLVAESAGRRETLKDALRSSFGDIPQC
jgi:transcription-repair coupling factor (superfamily II helicase)